MVSVRQEIPLPWRNPTVSYCVHGTVLSQMNPVHIFIPYSFRSTCIFKNHSCSVSSLLDFVAPLWPPRSVFCSPPRERTCVLLRHTNETERSDHIGYWLLRCQVSQVGLGERALQKTCLQEFCRIYSLCEPKEWNTRNCECETWSLARDRVFGKKVQMKRDIRERN